MAVRAESGPAWGTWRPPRAARGLTPYADRMATGSVAVAVHGSQLALGELAAAAGDRQAAAEHLGRARRVHEALDLPVWVTLTDEAAARLDLPPPD